MNYGEAIRELEALATDIDSADVIVLQRAGLAVVPRHQKLIVDALRRWASELRTQSIP